MRPTFQRNIGLHLHGFIDLNSKMEVVYLSETLVLTSWSTLCKSVESSALIFCLLIVMWIFRKDGLFVCFRVYINTSLKLPFFDVDQN